MPNHHIRFIYNEFKQIEYQANLNGFGK